MVSTTSSPSALPVLMSSLPRSRSPKKPVGAPAEGRPTRRLSLLQDCQATTARVARLVEQGRQLKPEFSDEASQLIESVAATLTECVVDADLSEELAKPFASGANAAPVAGTLVQQCPCDSEVTTCASTSDLQPVTTLPSLVDESLGSSEKVNDSEGAVVATLSSSTSKRRPSLPNIDGCLSSLENHSGAATFGRAQSVPWSPDCPVGPGQYEVEKFMKHRESHAAPATFQRGPGHDAFQSKLGEGPSPAQYDVERSLRAGEQLTAPATFNRAPKHDTFNGHEGPAPGDYDVLRGTKAMECHAVCAGFSRSRRDSLFRVGDGPSPGQYNVDEGQKARESAHGPATFQRSLRHKIFEGRDGPDAGLYNVEKPLKIVRPKSRGVTFSRGPGHSFF